MFHTLQQLFLRWMTQTNQVVHLFASRSHVQTTHTFSKHHLRSPSARVVTAVPEVHSHPRVWVVYSKLHWRESRRSRVWSLLGLVDRGLISNLIREEELKPEHCFLMKKKKKEKGTAGMEYSIKDSITICHSPELLWTPTQKTHSLPLHVVRRKNTTAWLSYFWISRDQLP